MKPLIILLFILVGISNSKGDFSIGTFINYLRETKIYELFEEIKYSLGNDVCIYFCKELIGSNRCEEFVKIYLNSKLRALSIFNLKKRIFNMIIKRYYQILLNAGFSKLFISILMQKMKLYLKLVYDIKK